MPGASAARLASKEKSLHASEQERDDVQADRAAWRAEQPAVAAEDLIFLDESGVDLRMVRRHARARTAGGVAAAPAGHWRRLTLLGALGVDGLAAMMTVPRATDTEVFLAVEQALLPLARSPSSARPARPPRSPRVLAAFASGVEGPLPAGLLARLNRSNRAGQDQTALRNPAPLEALDEAMPAFLETISARDEDGSATGVCSRLNNLRTQRKPL